MAAVTVTAAMAAVTVTAAKTNKEIIKTINFPSN
jgi:hypothetical protein